MSEKDSNCDPKHGKYWHEDGDVILEVHSFDQECKSELFRVHKPYWVENHLDGDGLQRVVIRDENLDRFRLFLDWICEGQGRDFDVKILEQILTISDRYLCAGFRETCRKLTRFLPKNFELLCIAFEFRLDEALCCQLASWGIHRSSLVPRMIMRRFRSRWALNIMQLSALYYREDCSICRAKIASTVSDPNSNWDSKILKDYECSKCYQIWASKDALKTLTPFKFDLISD